MPESRKKILLVDDEPILLEALSEYLLERDGNKYTILTALNGHKALEIMAYEYIDMVVSDIFMPEISGIHLLAYIKERYPETPVILMTAYFSEQIRMKAEKGGCLHFIEKPFEFAQIRDMIHDNIFKKEDGFVGTLRNIALTDLIQMCCLSSVSMAIRVTNGAIEGMIYIQEGEIIHAKCGDIKGESAFYRILGWGTGSFETLDLTIVPSVSIDKNWQSLLMEAVRRIDDKETDHQDSEPGNEQKLPDQKDAVYAEAKQHNPIGVLVVDDSLMMFNFLGKMLGADKEITVLGRAKNGAEALEKVQELSPDLITLDVNMPVMDGGTTLKHIMLKNPCPVIIISSMGSGSKGKIIDFLRLGAIDFLAKPSKDQNMDGYQKYLINKVKLASQAKVENFKRVKNPKIHSNKKISESEAFSCERLVIIKSGYGGYAEIMRIIPELPSMLNTSVLIFQSAPSELVLPLSEYLDQRSLSHIFTLSNIKGNPYEMKLNGGACYIGSDRIPISFSKNSSGFFINIGVEDDIAEVPEGYYFNQCLLSIAKIFPGKIQVILLSGSEIDSLEGIQKIREKGGRIIAQTPKSSMVPFSIEKIVRQEIVDITADPYKIAEMILLSS